VKYIFSHAGGTIPYLATRFSIIDEMNVIPGAEERGAAADTLRRLYWDTALSWRPPVLRMLRSAVGMGQVLFGSDYPYLRRDLAVACRHEVETSAELDGEERRTVLADNALKLFPRLAARAPTKKESAHTLSRLASWQPRSPFFRLQPQSHSTATLPTSTK